MTKILVIEDEAVLRQTIIELLKKNNFQVIGGGTGSIGLHLAKAELPDLIICDLMMRDLDGYQVLSSLRDNLTTASIPFIFLTGKTDWEALRKGMELGADDYIPKPFSASRLLKAIATQLQKRDIRKQCYITEIQQKLVELNHLMEHDRLTNLPNRLALRDRFNKMLAHHHKNEQTSKIFPIFCLGIDRFHRINDSLGYQQGDILLQAVAKRLTTVVGSEAITARLGADEFAVISPPVKSDKSIVASLAKKIQKHLTQPFCLNEQEFFLTFSIGIVFYPHHAEEIEKLLQYARKAMSKAKRRGGNCYVFGSENLNINSLELLSLERELCHALEREQLQIYYQPQIELQTHKIVSCEALLRWQHPLKGYIAPDQFIPLAEEIGLINRIGEWLLAEGCKQIKTWQQKGCRDLRLAVNLSAHQFKQNNLTQKIADILTATNLDSQYLELELTESSLVDNPESATHRLFELKALGISIAIDDFGTGYCSLGYLQQFPFDLLKIDQCFVRNLWANEKNQAIVIAIIQMARALKLKIIVEGIETAAELDFFNQHQCHLIQGYFYSPPLSSVDFYQLLLSGKPLLLTT